MTVLRLRDANLFWHEFEREIVALDATESHYYAANPSGAVLWRRLRDGATEAELAEVLCERYGIARDAADADVHAFVQKLSARGLLEAA